MARRRSAPICRYAEVPMDDVPLADLAQRHQDALAADQVSPKTRRFDAWGQRQAGQDLAALLGRAATLADWRDPELQRRRYRLVAAREAAGRWRRATGGAQFRADSGWEAFLEAEGLLDPEERITGMVIRRPKETTPQKTPPPVELLRESPRHCAPNRYKDL